MQRWGIELLSKVLKSGCKIGLFSGICGRSSPVGGSSVGRTYAPLAHRFACGMGPRPRGQGVHKSDEAS